MKGENFESQFLTCVQQIQAINENVSVSDGLDIALLIATEKNTQVQPRRKLNTFYKYF